MTFLSRILELEEALKLRLVTGAFEIVHWLYVNGPTTSRELSRETKVSPANFQMILRRLREESVVIIEIENDDKRRRRYALAPDTLRRMIAVDPPPSPPRADATADAG